LLCPRAICACADAAPMMHVLFVCSRNRRRSPTAEALFAGREGIEALSAGTAVDAETTVSSELIAWADIIFTMETVHRGRLEAQFGALLKQKKLIVLGIADKYRYMDAELIELLLKKTRPFLRAPQG
jgi:predicted protein tyrosine phosphatase